MKHLLLLIFVLIPFSFKAQSSTAIDSLKTLLSKLPDRRNSFQTDTTRVRLLCTIADKFNNPDSTIKYAQQAKLIAKKLNWVDGEFESGFLHGRGLAQTNLYYQALDVYFGLLVLTEKYHFRKREAIVLRVIGNINFSLVNYKLAYQYYLTSMKIFKDMEEYEEYADTQNFLATAYTQDNQAQKAVFFIKFKFYL